MLAGRVLSFWSGLLWHHSFSSVILNGCCLPPHCVMYAVMNYSIDRESEGHIFERMLAVFTLMFGMEGSQKLVRKLSSISKVDRDAKSTKINKQNNISQ